MTEKSKCYGCDQVFEHRGEPAKILVDGERLPLCLYCLKSINESLRNLGKGPLSTNYSVYETED